MKMSTAMTTRTSTAQWDTAIVSKTVTAVCWYDDLIVVESIIESVSLAGLRTLPRGWPTTARRYVLSGVIATSPDDIVTVDESEWSQAADETPFGRGGVALEFFVEQFPGSGHGVAHTGVVTGPHTLHTRAGVLDDCWETRTTGSARSGSSRWFCTGVGNVQYGDGGCGIGGCWSATADLIDYHIAELPE
jgi:hypothetical protein